MSRNTTSTRLCGCGECRFKAFDYVCPQKDSKQAVWLWSHTGSTEEPDQEEAAAFLEPASISGGL